MKSFDGHIAELLEELRCKGMLRELPSGCDWLIDLCSNDYLGFARSSILREQIAAQLLIAEKQVGSTGSRLLTGNSLLAEETESRVASWLRGKAALLFSTGYAANVGLLSAVAGREDVVLYDELVHASIRDGIRLSGAKGWKFRHNDLSDLEALIRRAPRRGRIVVVVEGVYSMDGDRAPLEKIVELCEKNGCDCIVDEAHSTGILGPHGAGLVVEQGLENRVAARVHTFGKAAGVHGAAVVGSEKLRCLLINRARSFIYSTAPADSFFIAIGEAAKTLAGSEGEQARKLLWERIQQMKLILARIGFDWEGMSPIFPFIFPGVSRVRQAAAIAREAGFHVLPIVSPTVPAGLERIRLCLHSFDTVASYRDIIELLSSARVGG